MLAAHYKLLKQKHKNAGSSHNKDVSLRPRELSSDEAEYYRSRALLRFEEAPQYLRFNRFIRTGYRNFLSTRLCLESVFWWTNETINIWSHLFGYFFFLGLTISDLTLLNIQASFIDKLIVSVLLFSFQVTMLFSSLYHTFSCRSETDFHCFLGYDLLGITLSFLAYNMSGIYFAFWCFTGLRYFYLLTVAAFFGIAMVLQMPRFKVDDSIKMLVFVVWAVYGVVPIYHWTIAMGGLAHPMVKLMLPRVLGMYPITGLGFLLWRTRVPERWFAGRMDFLGHSHQWWHILTVLAFYYWYNSVRMYVECRFLCESNSLKDECILE